MATPIDKLPPVTALEAKAYAEDKPQVLEKELSELLQKFDPQGRIEYKFGYYYFRTEKFTTVRKLEDNETIARFGNNFDLALKKITDNFSNLNEAEKIKALKLASREYKFHLMPDPKFIFAVLEKILLRLKEDSSLAKLIYSIKVIAKPSHRIKEINGKTQTFPIIVIYPLLGKNIADRILGELLVLFPRGSSDQYALADLPRFNARVSRLICCLQSGGDLRNKFTLSQTDRFLTPSLAHFTKGLQTEGSGLLKEVKSAKEEQTTVNLISNDTNNKEKQEKDKGSQVTVSNKKTAADNASINQETFWLKMLAAITNVGVTNGFDFCILEPKSNKYPTHIRVWMEPQRKEANESLVLLRLLKSYGYEGFCKIKAKTNEITNERYQHLFFGFILPENSKSLTNPTITANQAALTDLSYENFIQRFAEQYKKLMSIIQSRQAKLRKNEIPLENPKNDSAADSLSLSKKNNLKAARRKHFYYQKNTLY